MIPNLLGVWIVVAAIVWLLVGTVFQTTYALHIGVLVGALVSILQFRSDLGLVIAETKKLLKIIQ